ncbi:MAG: multidrug MFS transporter, partial [Tabrizicola sp.]|nr:multidrug MFS transporter [Tabrizicola sp.]
DWHAIFLAYIAFSGLTMLWLGLRQPETLPVAARRTLNPADLIAATRELFRHRIVLVSTFLQALTLGALFATLSTIQPIFEIVHGRADSFPLWFAVIAVASMSGSLLNSRIVMTLGMRRVVRGTYVALILLTLATLAVLASGIVTGDAAFVVQLIWSVGLFATMGLTMGNLNALAMEPVGYIAGLAASVISALATIGSVLLAIPVGIAFDGTSLPLLAGVAVLIGAALVLAHRTLDERRS